MKKASSLPEFIRPQLARLVETPPSGGEWIHEVKYDGYRVSCRLENGRVKLRTRNGLDWTTKFAGLAKDCARLNAKNAILDGELVAIDEDGRTSFSLLLEALREGRTDGLVYYAFDLLHLNGRDLQDETLLERKRLLQSLLERSACERILFSEHWRNDGRSMLKATCSHRLEGIISKDAEGTYHSGRSDGWLKSKCKDGQEFVIGGYTKGGRDGLGALLLGVYEPTGELRYVGRVGTGFDSKTARSMRAQFRSLDSKQSPFTKGTVRDAREVSFLNPRLVANVEFAGWTADGHLRHASFQGLREDKVAPEVVAEIAAPRLTHPERVVYPELGLTKQDVFDYYSRMSAMVLPFIAGRPMSLLRCPDGVAGECFFQKNDDEGLIEISDRASLLKWVQMGAIEFHPRGAHTETEDRADVIIFDLDPGEGVTWKQIRQAAFDLRDLLTQLGLKSFVKLSGGKGLHIQVPLEPRYSWDHVKNFCKSVARQMSQQEPARFTADIAKAKRKGRIFIDYLRNSQSATAVAPYSLRAREPAGVAWPLTWKELETSRSGDEVSLKVAKPRRDPWKGYVPQRIALLDSVTSKT